MTVNVKPKCFLVFITRSCWGFQSSMMLLLKWSPLCSGRGCRSPMRWFVSFLSFGLNTSSFCMNSFWIHSSVYCERSRFTTWWRSSWLTSIPNTQTSQMLADSWTTTLRFSYIWMVSARIRSYQLKNEKCIYFCNRSRGVTGWERCPRLCPVIRYAVPVFQTVGLAADSSVLSPLLFHLSIFLACRSWPELDLALLSFSWLVFYSLFMCLFVVLKRSWWAVSVAHRAAACWGRGP